MPALFRVASTKEDMSSGRANVMRSIVKLAAIDRALVGLSQNLDDHYISGIVSRPTHVRQRA
jgi:hypothetical protein